MYNNRLHYIYKQLNKREDRKMKATVFFDDFWNMYQRTDGYKNQYTRAGAEVLFNYLESLEQDSGEEMECDIIAIACEYSEATPEQYKESY